MTRRRGRRSGGTAPEGGRCRGPRLFYDSPLPPAGAGEDYQGKGFDLVLAGHAHGGQWRIPGVLNGLLAPDQGLLPAYAGGLYALEDTTLVVSRGLARESTRVPRLFNPPELVILDVIPAR